MAYVRRIIHLDTDAATQIAVVSASDISDPRAIEASFTKLRIGGDADGQLKLKDTFLDRGTLEIGQYIAFEYSAGVRWYLGRIEEIIEHSPNEVDVSLYGMWSELNEVFPGGFAESNLGKPHRFQASDFNPNDPDFSYQTADVVSQPDELVRKVWELYIAPSTNVGIGVIEECTPEPGLDGFVFRGTESAAEILRSLAVMCNNASVGVDENGLLYFQQPSTNLLATFQEGVDCEELQLRTDRSLLYNYMILTGGYVYGANTGSGFYRFVAEFQQESSVSTYGQRGLQVYIPWIRRNKDAETFAENFFARYASPTARAELKTDCQTALLKPQDGQIEVLDRNGSGVSLDYFDELKVEFNHCPIFSLTVGPEDATFPATPTPERWELGTPGDRGDGQQPPPGPIASQNIGTYAPPSSSSGQPVDEGPGEDCILRDPNGVALANDGGANWNNPTNALTTISNFASCTLSAGQTSRSIIAKNFGFNDSEVSEGYTVKGVKVRIFFKAALDGAGETVEDAVVRLTTNGLTGEGDNKAQGVKFDTTGDFEEYGSTNDMWGITLTREQVQSPNFGVVIAVENTGSVQNTGYIGEVGIEICTEQTASSGGGGGGGPVSSDSPSSNYPSDDTPVSSLASSDAPTDGQPGESSGKPSDNEPSSDAASGGAGGGSGASSGLSSTLSSDFPSSNSPSGNASSGGISGGRECGECSLPDTLYVRQVSDGSLVTTVTHQSSCDWLGGGVTLSYGFVPSEGGDRWTFAAGSLSGGATVYLTELDSCTGTLATDGGLYYVADN